MVKSPLSSPASDEELMVQYAHGNTKAFETLYERHKGRVYGFLSKRLTGSEVDDVFQQVFAKLHQSKERYNPTLPFLPWLYVIARSVLIDFSRKKVMTVAVPAEKLNAWPAEEQSGHQPDFLSLLSTLQDEERALLEMRFQEGLTFEELQHRTGVNSQTLRKRVSRLIERLRQQ